MVFNIVITAHDTSVPCYERIAQLPGIAVAPYNGTIFINAELTAPDETSANGMIHELTEENADVINIVKGEAKEEA